MSKRTFDEKPVLLAVVFVICGIAILVLNVINYYQDGRFSSFSAFGFVAIFIGVWLYSQGKKSKSGDGSS